jgi:DNA-binding NtrC family response regulator
MTLSKPSAGGDFLAQKSDVTQAKREQLPKLRDILIVEDEGFDERRLTAVLNIVMKRDCNIRIARSLTKAIDAVLEAMPDMMFLDDYLEPNDSALETIPLVRRAGYQGPIIVLSGEWDRERAVELKKAGASDSMHKENINSVELGAMLVRAFKSGV